MTTTARPGTRPSLVAAPAAVRTRRRLAAGALAVAGVALVVGHGLTVDPSQPARTYLPRLAEHHTAGTVGGLLTVLGALLLVPGTTALLGLVTGRGARLATVGGLMWGASAAVLAAGDAMITLVMSALVPGHTALARALFAVSDHSSLLGLPFAFAPFFVLGAVLVAVALLVGRAVPAHEALLLLVGAALVFLSSGGGWVTAALVLVPLGAALVLLGRRAWLAA